jgi:hypothetical protein
MFDNGRVSLADGICAGRWQQQGRVQGFFLIAAAAAAAAAICSV